MSQPRAQAIIHTGWLVQNYNTIKNQLRPGCKICAMVKADAYGHGLLIAADALAEQADYFGVATIGEALTLRQAGITTPILIMGYTAEEDIPKLAENTLTQIVYSEEYAALLSKKTSGPLLCHLKIDTGMHRLGFDHCDIAGILRALALPHLVYEGIMTHFACADQPEKPATLEQFSRFTDLVDKLAVLGHVFAIRHTANSGAILHFPQTHLDMVRPGLLLYGMTPDFTPLSGLRPVMELAGVVESIHNIPMGEPVSYGGTYICEKDTLAATISLGYADGVNRALSNRGFVLINGQRAPIIGSVCMDHLIADISGLTGIKTEMSAYILGGGPNGVTADEIAKISGTISYEIICHLSNSRVLRVVEEHDPFRIYGPASDAHKPRIIIED